MKTVLVSIIFILMIVNTMCFICGRKYLKVKDGTPEEIEENFKKGKRYFFFTSIISFITIIVITIIAINSF